MSELRLDQSVSPQQKQKQRLIVSQKHQQAIKLLQYPVQRVEHWLTGQLQENPLLELQGGSEEEAPSEPEDEEDDLLEEDIDWDELVNKGDDFQTSFSGSPGGTDIPDAERSLRALAESHETLQDSLQRQLQLKDFPPEKVRLGNLLISYLDKDGYFSGQLEEIAEAEDVPIEKLEELLGVIQQLEPAGVGGRDLEEVLLLQLDQLDMDLPPRTNEIIQHHLEDLEKRSFNKISSNLEIEAEEVQRVADLVRELEPRPGRRFNALNRQYVEPEVEVRKLDGNLIVVLNDDRLPPLRINARYRAMLESGDPDLEEYVKEKLSGALWVINCIYQRQQTMYKVVENIFERQDDFFKKGEKGIKPLVMKEVADSVDRHESTVSRAVRDKYVQTPRGLYELKFFFAPGLDSTEGKVSSVAVKAHLKDLIENEDKTDPLNDRQLKEALEEQGIEIGRRTISKYRKQLQIPTWKLRKRVTNK